MQPLASWISPKMVKGKPSSIHGKGCFAVVDISQDDLVAIKAGHIIDRATLEKNRSIIQDSELQLTDDLFLAPLSPEELLGSMVYINHSCDPNTQFEGAIIITASRDIKAGEELTIDYGMYFAYPEFKMACNCNRPGCRKMITGHDWKNPALQEKYRGHFAWFIEQKIKKQA